MNGLDSKLPLISVIVPVYNTEKFLCNCIESVQKQSYTNYELVLIDDGSTDHSSQICDEYASIDPKIRVIHKNNSGVSDARNKGLDICKGQYLMFLDSDDCIKENCLKILFENIQKYNADIVSGITVDSSYKCKNGEKYEIWKKGEGIKESLSDNHFAYAVWAKLYRREVIGNTRFRSEYRINEDSLFVFELLCKEIKFVGISEEVYFYRNNPNSASNARFSEKYFDILKVSNVKFKIIENNFPDYISLAQNMKLKSFMNILQLLAIRTEDEYSKQERSILNLFYENSKYYISIKKSDDIWYYVLKFRMYWIYKTIMRLKING